MSEPLRFVDLPTADKWGFVGSILICFGSLAMSVAQVLRLSSSGRLGQQPVSPGPSFNEGGAGSARNFFT